MDHNYTDINKTNNHLSPKESVDHRCLEVIVHFVDIGRNVDHHCLEVIVHFVDICGIVDHHCLEVIVHFVDIVRIVDHLCLEVIVLFVDIGRIVDQRTITSNLSSMNIKQKTMTYNIGKSYPGW
jgi:hypothetical protein